MVMVVVSQTARIAGGVEDTGDGYIKFQVGLASTLTDVGYWDSDGNLGIGTNTPTQKLHVQGNACFTGEIDVGGDMGIGTTPAAWHSSYDGVLQIANSSMSDNAGTQFDVGINFYYDGAYKKIFDGLASRYTQAAGEHYWSTVATGTGTFTFSEVMRIDAAGCVGIGTTAPDGLLHIYTGSAGVTASSNADELVLESSAHAGLSILSGNTSRGSIYFGDSGSNAYGIDKLLS